MEEGTSKFHARSVTCSKFHTVEPQQTTGVTWCFVFGHMNLWVFMWYEKASNIVLEISGAIVQDLFSWATVHSDALRCCI